MTFFSHPLYVCYLKYGNSLPIFDLELLFHHQKFLLKAYFSQFAAFFASHPITVVLEILGVTDSLAVPHLKFWRRTALQLPRSLCPWLEY